MSKLLYLWRMKILWGQFPSSGICSVHKGGRKVCISFEDWETPYELFLLPPLCLLLIHPTLSNNQHTPELCWNKESNGEKKFFDETKIEHITPLPASYKHCCCACFFLHLDFTSNCCFHSRWFICLWVTRADYCGWVFVISWVFVIGWVFVISWVMAAQAFLNYIAAVPNPSPLIALISNGILF